jgi:hypothetical protein
MTYVLVIAKQRFADSFCFPFRSALFNRMVSIVAGAIKRIWGITIMPFVKVTKAIPMRTF